MRLELGRSDRLLKSGGRSRATTVQHGYGGLNDEVDMGSSLYFTIRLLNTYIHPLPRCPVDSESSVRTERAPSAAIRPKKKQHNDPIITTSDTVTRAGNASLVLFGMDRSNQV